MRKRKNDGSYEAVKEDYGEPNILEKFFAAVIAIGFVLPMAMLGLLLLKLFGLEDRMAKKIAKFVNENYYGGCH